MGGVDKGLQNHLGMALAMHALLRLAPQVGPMMVNANRNLAAYESMGVPVWPDVVPEYAGPLAGFLTGLERCESAFLCTVPCDSPGFPLDLVETLAGALDAQDADIAMAATLEQGMMRTQPVFCLMRTEVTETLIRFIHTGQRKIDKWTAQHRCVEVPFADAGAFANANTVDELRRLQP